MNKSIRGIHTNELVTAVFITLFSYTAVDKLLNHSTFRMALVQSPLLEHYADYVAVAIPVAELVVVALLIINTTRIGGLRASLGLMIAFTLYILGLMLFADHLPCNCGGILNTLSWKAHLVVNLVLTALAGWAVWRTKRKRPKLN